MAFGRNDDEYAHGGSSPKKADVILQTNRDIYVRVNELTSQINKNSAQLENALAQLNKSRQDAALSARQVAEIYNSLTEEYESVKREMKYLAAQSENIYLDLTGKINQLISMMGGTPVETVAAPVSTQAAEIDYDLLAKKIAEQMPAQEYISPDYIACKVAEQIVVPAGGEVRPQPAAASASDAAPAEAIYSEHIPVDLQVDEDELADKIALRIGSLKPEDFDILVDDEGCASISEELARKIDYDILAVSIAERLRSALASLSAAEPDYEDMAQRISEKITVAGVNEDAIADKAAAVLSNYLPEIDTDEIADKVASQLVGTVAGMDTETISSAVSEKLAESQAAHDYDIVIDGEGLEKLTESVTEEVLKNTENRFDAVDREIASIKAMLALGAVREVAAAAEADDNAALVTVSDVVEGEEEGEENGDEVLDEIDEQPSEGEIMPDGFSGSGVDFENMMKYNRSFIARIIQGTDEQKQYYGQVKNALLSYAKVNSNVAWGAERFNKGRETIARFKIRGKTLCLYLALDPAEYKTSVYHHVDVSDNKSMHGTPMMVKIKSPLGAKKAIRLIDEMLEKRNGVKRNKAPDRDYAAMYPYETIEELIEDGLVKDVSNK